MCTYYIMDCDQIVYIGLFIIAAIFIYNQLCKGRTRPFQRGGFEGYSNNGVSTGVGCPVNNKRNSINADVPDTPASSEKLGKNEVFKSVDSTQVQESCYPQTILTSSDLLPSHISADITKFKGNNIGQGIDNAVNFLDAGYHIGINTVGQSLRNANKGLRSEPPNPQVSVSPWMNTTIGPDLERKPVDLGDTCIPPPQ